MKSLFALSFLVVLLSSVSSVSQVRKPAKPAKPKPATPMPIPRPALSPEERFYQHLGNTTIWTRDGAVLPTVNSLRALLLRAGEHGLNRADYWTADLERRSHAVTAETAADFEAAATEALLRYSAHVATGRLNDPRTVGDDVKLARQSLDVARVAEVVKSIVPDWAPAFDAHVAPAWPAYESLKVALARWENLDESQWPSISIPRKDPKVGDKDQVYANVKIRLRTLGYKVTETDVVYTKALQSLVKTYIADHSLSGASDLRRSGPFWKQISVSLSARAQQIRLTMEKLRWLGRPENRYVFVNLAFQRLIVRENNETVLSMRTINGRSERKSPSLRDRIVNVELNPDWAVPTRLILEDKIPVILSDRSFFERNGYEVFDRYGRELDPYWDVDWRNITKQNVGQITIRQKPGLGNALGVMKFNLTNPYAIYLHDTNERYLFPNNHRLLSSGCVRLERPFDLSAYLLRDHPQWSDPRRVQDALAKTKIADYWTNTEVYIPLKAAVPVYLMYLTVDAEGDVIKFAADYYGQDQALFEALRR